MAGDSPQNAACCTGDEFLRLATFSEAQKCFSALGLMACAVNKEVCQQTMQRIPGEQGKQLSSLAPSAQKAAILWGRELIAPSVALGLLEGEELCLPRCLVPDTRDVKGCLSRRAGTREQERADSPCMYKVQFCCYCVGFMITVMSFQYIIAVARVHMCVTCQAGIDEVRCFRSELVLGTLFCLLVQCDVE